MSWRRVLVDQLVIGRLFQRVQAVGRQPFAFGFFKVLLGLLLVLDLMIGLRKVEILGGRRIKRYGFFEIIDSEKAKENLEKAKSKGLTPNGPPSGTTGL